MFLTSLQSFLPESIWKPLVWALTPVAIYLQRYPVWAIMDYVILPIRRKGAASAYEHWLKSFEEPAINPDEEPGAALHD